MGCNCGGAKRQSGAKQQAGSSSRGSDAKPALRGTKAPGYYWEGPKKRAAQDGN